MDSNSPLYPMCRPTVTRNMLKIQIRKKLGHECFYMISSCKYLLIKKFMRPGPCQPGDR